MRHHLSLLRALFAVAVLLIACPIARGQEISLRKLFNPGPPPEETTVGYEVESGWPSGHDESEHGPWGEMSAVEIDREGLVWTLNRGDLPVQVFDADGKLMRSWGAGQFRKPHGLGFAPDGTVWIADAGSHVARQYTPEGTLLRTLGVEGVPGDDAAHFDQPTDVAVARDGTIYVSDGYGNNRVAVFGADGRFLRNLGGEGTAPGEFRLPHALALDSQGRLYVADRSNARVQVFAPDGTVLGEWRNLLIPWDISIDSQDRVFVCGSAPMRWPRGARTQIGVPLGIPPRDQLVMRFDTDGRVEELWSFPMGNRPGMVDWLHGLAVDPRGDLYMGDIQGRRVQKFTRLEPSDPNARPAP